MLLIGVYLGCMELKWKEEICYYNFRPVYLYEQGQFYRLTKEQLYKLLPASAFENIHLYAPNRDFWMFDHLKDHQLLFVEFTASDLVDNVYGPMRERHKTGYRLDITALEKQGHIRQMDELEYFQVLEQQSLLADCFSESIIPVKGQYLYEGQLVYLLPDDQTLLGPYPVGYRRRDGVYYVDTGLMGAKYILSGYAMDGEVWDYIEETYCGYGDERRLFIRLPDTAVSIQYDILSEEQLIQNFCESLPDGLLTDGKLSLACIDQAVAAYHQSFLMGSGIHAEIIRGRLEIVRRYLTDSKHLADVFAQEKTQKLEMLSSLQEDVAYLEKHKYALTKACDALEQTLDGMLQNAGERMAQFTFDGVIAGKWMKHAAQWEQKNCQANYRQIAEQIAVLPCDTIEQAALVDYLCTAVQQMRPSYERNFIINILVCLFQGFLTIFSGPPGMGKTSICHILANVLGLTQIAERLELTAEACYVQRYIPVSVERGWTSKRDLIGYYNPLTRAFDDNDRRLYDGLRILDCEYTMGSCHLPFLILLDEANLSPMEYYWADFMAACDEEGSCCTVGFGSSYQFHLPETLRFAATMNHDHTTEALSPRLIDRSWIIRLPEVGEVTKAVKQQPLEGKLLSWEALKQTFLSDMAAEQCEMGRAEKTYQKICAICRQAHMAPSIRADRAIRRYWTAAQRLFIPDGKGRDTAVIALDYAIAQRVLPKIMGAGENIRIILEDLQKLCRQEELCYTVNLLDGILQRGQEGMGYYLFF